MSPEDRLLDDEPEGERTADELLVHALLLGRLRDTPERSQRRLSRVREAIVPLERRRRWSIVGSRFSLAAAASVLIVLTVLLFLTPDNPALADVDRILQRLGETDQTYAIELHEESADSPSRFGGRRFGPGRRMGAGRQNPYDGAKLYVRGERYALISPEQRGPRFAKGFDGESHWSVGHERGFLRNRRGGSEPTALEELLLEVTVDLNELLEEMRAGYEVSAPTRIPATEDLPELAQYLATPRRPLRNGPSRIQLWADAETGQLDRMICSGLRVRQPWLQYELVVTLLDTEPLPEQWFSRGAHEE